MNILNLFLKSKIFDNLNIFLVRKLFKIFKFFFVETELKTLPKINYPLIVIDKDLEHSKNFKVKDSRPYISYVHLPDLLEVVSDNKQKTIFVDYGAGNLGLFYYLNRKFKNIEYFFKDQLIIEEKVKKIIENDKIKNLYLGDNIGTQEIDLLYFGSSLQYIDNYKNILKTFFKKSKYILISQTPFFDNENYGETIIIKQLNMHPDINYLNLFNFNFFLDFMKKNDYQLIERNVNRVTKFLNFKNFDKNKFKDIDMYDLLFKYKKNEK